MAYDSHKVELWWGNLDSNYPKGLLLISVGRNKPIHQQRLPICSSSSLGPL